MPYVPDSVFESGVWETLSGTEAKVYTTICKHYNRKDRMAFPGMTRMASICGTHRTHVSRAVKSLAEKGLIVIRKKENTHGGKDFNYYLMPDFLLYEYSELKKDPTKNGVQLVEITNLLIQAIPSAKSALASAKNATGRAKSATKLVPNPHPNYIMNHITIINNFNKPSEKKQKTTNGTNRFQKHEEPEQPFSDPMNDVMREKYLKPLLEKLGRPI
jgi:predicted transcriptional regulator